MYKCFTLNHTENGTDFAKIFVMKKNFLGHTDFHENSIVFRVGQSNSYNGYVERQYFLSNIKGVGSNTILFKELDTKNYDTFYCVYEESETEITVYVKAPLGYTPVRVFVDYCQNEGRVEFITGSHFNYTPSNPVHAVKERIKELTPTMNNGWTLNDQHLNEFLILDKRLKIKCSLASGSVWENVSVLKLPVTLDKPVLIMATFTNSNGDIFNTRGALLVNGEITLGKGIVGKSVSAIDISLECKLKSGWQ